MVRRPSWPRLALTCPGLALWLAGCAGGATGSELSARPRPRPLSAATERVLRIPEDEKFSITFAPSTRAPGLGGAAEASSSASRDGAAEARASVEQAGTASASFQVGHAFENDSDRQTDLQLRVRCEHEHEATASSEARPDASVALWLYVRDQRNRLLRSIRLVEHTTVDGGASLRGNEDFDFTLTLAPRDAANVFLAGVVSAEAAGGRSASGTLRLRALSIEAQATPAPPVKTASDATHEPG